MSITETNVAELRSNLADALDSVTEGSVVIVKRRGKAGAVIVDQDAYEDYLAATNPRLLRKTAKARAEILAGDTVSLEELLGK